MLSLLHLDLHLVKIICLVVIVLSCIACNTCAIVFINNKRGAGRPLILKDKIVILLCVVNILQPAGYLIELYSTVNNGITGGACQAAGFTTCMLTYTSIGYFVALTVERYLAIKEPYKYVVWFSEGRNTWWLGGAPIFGLLLGIGPLAGWGNYGKSRSSATFCCISFDLTIKSKSYFLFACVFAFVVPVAVTVVCFTRIISELRRKANDMKRKYGRGSSLDLEGRRVVKEQWLACLMTGVVYLGSWVPYASVCFVQLFGGDVGEGTELFSLFLSKSSTISSPIIYCLIERRFRSYVRLCLVRYCANFARSRSIRPVSHLPKTGFPQQV